MPKPSKAELAQAQDAFEASNKLIDFLKKFLITMPEEMSHFSQFTRSQMLMVFLEDADTVYLRVVMTVAIERLVASEAVA